MTGFAEIAAAGPVLTAIGVCMLAGLVSFASPCVVPLVPGYLSYLAAIVGVEEQPGRVAVRAARLRVAGAAALFVAGFTTVFVLGTVAVLGMTTSLISNQLLLQRIGGVITIVMGLVFVGFIPALQREARFTPRQVSTLGGCPAAGCGLRIGLDAVSRPDADRCDRRGIGDRWRQCGPRCRVGDRILPWAGNPVRAVGLWLRACGARPWLAARHTRGIQIFGGVLLILVGAALVTGLWNDFVSWVRDAFVSDVTLPI